jgi:hypothetical protein
LKEKHPPLAHQDRKYQRPPSVQTARHQVGATRGNTGGLTRPIGGAGMAAAMGPKPPGGFGASPVVNSPESKIGKDGSSASTYDGVKSGIKIKPSHKGLLHKDLGVPQGQKIPKAKIAAAKNSPNPAVRKRAVFAQNFGHDAAPVDKVKKSMHEFKHGELHSGSKSGPLVKNRKQAIAIGLSEQRKEEKG